MTLSFIIAAILANVNYNGERAHRLAIIAMIVIAVITIALFQVGILISANVLSAIIV